MENCNSLLSIHSRAGTTRNDRVKPALQTDFFLLDERKEQDFILFVQRLSKYVNFYNEFDLVGSDWSHFFEKESTSILILIANWNIQLLQSNYENKKNEISLIGDQLSQKNKLSDYFKQIENEFECLVQKTKLLDNEIILKENLLSTSYAISNKFSFIINQINGSTDVGALLQNYSFNKATQQLFGLLLSWKDFTNSAIEYQLNSYSKHTPHYALFLSFLKLLGIAQKKLNEFTKSHLDFYYKDVLHIENQKARPDYVHLLIEPKDSKPFLIPKESIFPAGKNSLGQNIFYSSTTNQTVNGIKLHSFLSAHFNNSSNYRTDIASLNAKNKGFNVFSKNSQIFKEGLMIASPNLYMQSGERIIYIRFNGAGYRANDFNFYITGEENIIEITTKENSKERGKARNSFIKLTIPASEKKIVPFDAKIHVGFLVQTSFPVLKIVPKNVNVIQFIKKIELNVNVNQFKSFVLESDFGKIDTEKAFYPFSEFPKNGNGIMISSNEFFMKNNAVASFQLISDSSTSNYFNNKIATFSLDNNSYSEQTSALTVTNSYLLTEYDFNKVAGTQSVSNGKIRMELKHSAFAGEKFMLDYIVASQAEKTLPYKPRVKEFVFNYSINETLDLDIRKKENNPVELYHSLPFGYKKFEKGIFRFSQNKDLEGAIYLGFENVAPKNGLCFLIQLEEGTSNPLLKPASIDWKYLSNNLWTKFETNTIGDETISLTQSGLVSISIPDYKASKNTILSSNLFWLRISVSDVNAICNFIGVHTQALKAVLTDYENSGTGFLENTPKETITKTYSTLNQIEKISQPYGSFGGRVAEKDESLYTRTSERLRHKNRAITTWDYERIILHEFPEVYRVKALNHYKYDTKTSNVSTECDSIISNISAGYVTIIPIAKSSVSDVITWKPLLSLNKMLSIKKYLSKIASPHVRLNVKPPVLEKVKIQFKVKFHTSEGMDNRLYIEQLKDTINKYFCPWAYDTTEVNFAREIEFSSIIQLVDNQSFVDYITDFSVSQFILDKNNKIVGSPIKNLNEISPQTDITLFVPTDSHIIQEI